MTYVLVFIASGVVVVFAATALARHADAIAEVTGLGRLWIGSLLLAAATSLPELTTDIAAVRLGATDLAIGDLFGSTMANMLILGVIDLLPPRGQVLRRATLDHALSASLAIALNALAAVLVVVRPGFAIAGVSPASFLIFVAYLAGTRAVYRHASRESLGAAPAADARGTDADSAVEAPALRRAVIGFALAAAVVLASAPAFAWAAKGIAEITGLGNTFVGTWLVGLATSLPELVACVAAVRMGSFDLAVGNLFGSCAFNMAIFFPLDLVQPGSLFTALDPGHALSGLFAVVLLSLGLAAIVYRAERRYALLEPGSVPLLVTYALGIWLLYGHAVA